MEKSLRLIWVILVILMVVVIWVFIKESADCCDDVASLKTTVDDLVEKVDDCCGSGPGRGPIIILKPTSGGGTYSTSLQVSGATVTTWGNSGQLREDAFGVVDLFVASDVTASSTEFEITKTTMVIDNASTGLHTIVVERTPTGELSWTIDGDPFIACDFGSGSPPNCAGTGIPPEFNGTITSWTTEPATSTPTPPAPTSVAQVRIQGAR